jgi:hypothetical protein
MSFSGKAQTLLQYLILIFFLFLLFPPMFYENPESGLDNSWNLALQLAFKDHLVFGKDIVFTYGPLGILNYRLPIAVSKFGYLLFDGYFLATLFFVLRSIFKRHFSYGLAAFIFLCIMANQYGAMFQWFFLFFFFYLFSFVEEPRRIGHLIQAAFLSVLLLYFKASLGVTATAIFLLAVTYTLIRRKWTGKIFAAVLLAYFLSIWLGALLLHVELKGYILGSLQLIDGYNDAMARVTQPEYLPFLYTSLFTILIFLARTGWLLLVSFRRKEWLKNADQLFIHVITGLAIFILFKSAYVRSDSHAYIFIKNIPSLAAFTFLYNPGGFRKRVAAICCWIMLALSFWAVNAMPESYQPYLRILRGSFLSFKVGEMGQYFRQIGSFDSARAASDSLALGNNEYKAIIGNHSVDILPTEVSTLYFNGLHYEPRPVIQSYVAYTEYLDSLDAHKYRSPGAPDYLLFSVATIDGRVPFFDESRTKLTMLERYYIVGQIKDDLVLKKKEKPENLQPLITDTTFARLGEEIPVRKSPNLQFSRIFVEYNLQGRLRRLFYQPPYLKISLTLDDGRVRSFRAIVPVLADGVILNKFLESTDEMQSLMQSDGRLNTNVTSIRIEPDPTDDGFIPRIKMVNTYFSFPKKTTAELREDSLGMASLARMQDKYKPAPLDTSLYQRDTFRLAMGNVLNHSQMLKIQDGWAFREKYDNDHILIKALLRSEDKVYQLPTDNQQRPDLPAVFKRPDLINVGFSATVNKSQLPPGDYQLGILIIDTVQKKGWINYSTQNVIIQPAAVIEKINTNELAIGGIQQLQYGMDPQKVDDYRIYIKGWAFLQGTDPKDVSTSVILRSAKAAYRISTNAVSRKDVANSFHDPRLVHSGFSVTIPGDSLTAGTYEVGIEMRYRDGKGYSLAFTGQEVTAGIPDLVIPAPVAELPPTGNLDLGIDFIKEKGDTVTLSGWAVQKMEAVDSSSIEVLLKRDRLLYAAGTRTRSRPDVTQLFKSKFNLDDCGFFVKLSKKALPAGKYAIGIHVYRDGDKGVVRWLDQTIDVPK